MTAPQPMPRDRLARQAFFRHQRALRAAAQPGDRVHFGRANFGGDWLVLPVVRLTTLHLVCSDGTRTERAMIASGRRVGHGGRVEPPVQILPVDDAQAAQPQLPELLDPATLHAHLLQLLGATDHADAARIIADHHARDRAALA